MSGENTLESLLERFKKVKEESKIQDIGFSVEKTLALPENINIYYYAGHGSDLCDPSTHELRIGQVPEGCIYVTITECGMPTSFFDNETRERAFSNFDPEIKEIIRYAYLPKNLSQFAQLIDASPENIHFHFPGDSYVVNDFLPIAYHRLDSGPALGVSGLLDKTKMEQYLGDPKLVKIPSYDLSPLFNALDKDSYTKNDVLSLCSQYNITESFYKNEAILDEMFPDKDTILTMKDVKNFFSELSITVIVPEIIQQYQTSVYPTIYDVNDIFNIIAPGKHFLPFTPDMKERFQNEISIKLQQKSQGMNPTLNTTMMELFPGIHFNLMCRNVSDDCIPKAELRRAESLNVAKKQQNILQAKTTKGGTKRQHRLARKKKQRKTRRLGKKLK